MVDEVLSVASSDISESLRAQILGTKPRSSKAQIGRHTKPAAELRAIQPSEDFQSYHTAQGSGDLKQTPPAPDQRTSQGSARNSQASMQPASQERRFATIQTQTVAIQTVAQGCEEPVWDCTCSSGDHACACPECQPHNCQYGYSRFRRFPEETTSDFENYTDSSSQTVDVGRRCRCCDSTEFSDSEESYSTDFLDLPYQNKEEYLKLLRELERKLVLRNRERVRRTMMEFERRSRQNQNLDRPICDYDDDAASMLQKLATKRKACCKCGRRKKVNSDILQHEKRWDEMNCARNRVERSMHRSHWQLDPRTGEWVKVASFQQTDFAAQPSDCRCYRKKRR